jgi:hypothetical protein
MIYNGRNLKKTKKFDWLVGFSRALEASLLTSGLNETEIEEIRKQNLEPLEAGASNQDLSTIMELSKREEEARLNRLREEEEELEKVEFFRFHPQLMFFSYLYRFSNYHFKKNKINLRFQKTLNLISFVCIIQ